MATFPPLSFIVKNMSIVRFTFALTKAIKTEKSMILPDIAGAWFEGILISRHLAKIPPHLI